MPLGGGPAFFTRVLSDQLERRKRWDVPELDGDPDWTITIDGVDPELERVHESLLTLADGRLGTRGAPVFDHPSAAAGRRARRRLHGRRAFDRARRVPRLDTPPADPAEGPEDHAGASILPPGSSVRRGRSRHSASPRSRGREPSRFAPRLSPRRSAAAATARSAVVKAAPARPPPR